ncbi:MAG TPA: NUDIX domain-containing protein [Candidatus Saccharimonadales bacterium]
MHKPTDSVRIAIFNAQDLAKFLVVTEADDPDNWKLPGGKFEAGKEGIESPDDAANRELQEEIGINGAQIGLLSAATLTNDDGVSARYIFVGIAEPGAIKPSDEIAHAEWFAEATLPECKNKNHILAAVAAARVQFSHENTV